MKKAYFYFITFFMLLSIINAEIITSELDSSKTEFQTNLEESYQIAKSQNKYVLVYFSGSDWCRPCMQLQKEVFESEEFNKFADSKLVMARFDFPSKSENKLSETQITYNNSMAQKLNPQGQFPYLILFDTNQKELLSIVGYNRNGVQSIINQLKEKIVNE